MSRAKSKDNQSSAQDTANARPSQAVTAKAPKPKAKNPVGKPPRFKTPEELEIRVNDYFAHNAKATKPLVTKNGEIIQVPCTEPATMPGLCYFLGFSDRDAFADQARRGPDFARIVSRTRLRIEAERLAIIGHGDSNAAVVGNQFILANHFGYSAAHKVEHSGPGGGPIAHNLTAMTDEELRAFVRERAGKGAKGPKK